MGKEINRDPELDTPFHRTIHEAIQAAQQAQAQQRGVITLGKLIAELMLYPSDAIVFYDILDLVPTTLDSWRGNYADLALGYGDDDAPTVQKLLQECWDAVGRVFTGYKGGDFVMDEDTPVYVDNYGHCGSTWITHTSHNESQVTLHTMKGRTD